MKIKITNEQYDCLIKGRKKPLKEDNATDTSTANSGTSDKWADIAGAKQGPANQIGKQKWQDVVTTKRGVANPLK